MAEGSSWVTIDGIPICREGDLASCGHPATGAAFVDSDMTDLALAWNNLTGAGDICVVGADLLSDDGLETAILVSLFTDARVREEELPSGHTWRRGWWGDAVDDEPDVTGSKLWTLRRSKATQEVLVQGARRSAARRLRWLMRDGVAIAVEVQTFYPRPRASCRSSSRWSSPTGRGASFSSST